MTRQAWGFQVVLVGGLGLVVFAAIWAEARDRTFRSRASLGQHRWRCAVVRSANAEAERR